MDENSNYDVVRQFIKNCRTLLAINHPYFAHALYSCGIRVVGSEQKAPPIAAIDCRGIIYVNRDYFLPLAQRSSPDDVKETCFVIYHEMCHYVRRHFCRRANAGNPDMRLWNVATDLEINDKPPLGTKYPMKNGVPNVLLPSQFGFPDGLLAEEYLELLKEKGFQGQNLISDPMGNSGSGCDGVRREWEEIPDGEDDDGSLISKQVAEQIREFAKDAKFAGNIPASWKRWAEMAQPKIDWVTLLRRFLRMKAGNIMSRADYSFSRPNRRYSGSDLIFPSMVSRGGINVSIVIDTSGSMSPEKLGRAIAETVEILGVAKSLSIVYCDADITNVLKITKKGKDKDFRLMAENILGGGGTDMLPGIQFCIKAKSDLTIVFTDGILNFPKKSWKKGVFWVILSSGNHTPPPKEYDGDFIVLDVGK